MQKEITLREFIEYLQSRVSDQDRPIKGIGARSDGFYTIHVDDGYVQKIITVPQFKE